MLVPPSYRSRYGKGNRAGRPVLFSAQRLLSIGIAAGLVAGLFCGVTIAIEALWRVSVSVPIRAGDAQRLAIGTEDTGFPFIWFVPGVRDPEFVDPQDPRVGNFMTVIGVVVQGQARAYRLDAFKVPWFFPVDQEPTVIQRHVVNDLIGSSAVTITHCDVSDCTRVLIKPNQRAAMTLAVGGIQDTRMRLWYEGERYDQDDGSMPLEDAEFRITTWGKWVAAHPDSLLYFGTD